jgi:radical SAM-linked protein
MSDIYRYRVSFSKFGPTRFISHLDLARAWARLLRRAALPLAYTEGFNPHPRLNLAAALPLGFTSECELLDVWLKEEVPLPEIKSLLVEKSPPGITVHQVSEVDRREKSLQAQLRAIEYRAMLLDETELGGRIEALLAAGELPRERRGKVYDLRPLIEDLWLIEPMVIGMRLAARPGATGRPDEVLYAMGLDALSARIHRTRLIFDE